MTQGPAILRIGPLPNWVNHTIWNRNAISLLQEYYILSRLSHTANSAILATIFSHFLCCGLPVLVNILALVAGVGVFSAMVPWVDQMHEVLHQYEAILLAFSALALGFGYFVHRASAKRDCATESCNHEPCEPKKRQSRIILIVASVLFLVNLASFSWHQFM
jgi:hypothetical protein